jgi:hypothetical protein
MDVLFCFIQPAATQAGGSPTPRNSNRQGGATSRPFNRPVNRPYPRDNVCLPESGRIIYNDIMELSKDEANNGNGDFACLAFYIAMWIL